MHLFCMPTPQGWCFECWKSLPVALNGVYPTSTETRYTASLCLSLVFQGELLTCPSKFAPVFPRLPLSPHSRALRPSVLFFFSQLQSVSLPTSSPILSLNKSFMATCRGDEGCNLDTPELVWHHYRLLHRQHVHNLGLWVSRSLKACHHFDQCL